jgi:hypothetical protein
VELAHDSVGFCICGYVLEISSGSGVIIVPIVVSVMKVKRNLSLCLIN